MSVNRVNSSLHPHLYLCFPQRRDFTKIFQTGGADANPKGGGDQPIMWPIFFCRKLLENAENGPCALNPPYLDMLFL